MMNAKEMHEKVEELKEQVLLNNFDVTADVINFLKKNWMQILDILDDSLYEYLTKRTR